MNPILNFGGGFGRQFAARDFPSEILADGLESAIEEALLQFAHTHAVAAAGEDMRDAVAHGAGADDADEPHILNA